MNRLIVRLGLLCAVLLSSIVIMGQAQDTPPATRPLLERIAPAVITHGQVASITLHGKDFTPDTVASVDSHGKLGTMFNTSTQLTALVPATLANGQYDITLTNAIGSTRLTAALTVQLSPATIPTAAPMSITNTEPATITAGTSGVLSVQGTNFTESSVVRLVGVGLLPTTYLHSGALTATLPDTITPGGYAIEVTDATRGTASARSNLRVVPAPVELPTPQPLPTNAPIVREPSLAVSRVVSTPDLVQPGQAVQIAFTVTNRGNQTARLIGITLGETTEFMLAAGQTSLNVPDLLAGGTYTGQLTVTTSREIAAGVRSVPLAITYRDVDSKPYTETIRVSVTVSDAAALAQLMIDAYTLDPARLEAGDLVTLRLTIANRGTVNASQVMLRIAGENSILLPNGSSDTFFVGDVAAQQRIPLELSLRVSSKAAAGAQAQPLTLVYLQAGKPAEIATSITLDIVGGSKPQPQLMLSRYALDQENLQPGSRFTLTTTLHNVGAADAADTVVTFGTVQSTTPGDPNTPPTNPDGLGNQNNTTTSTTFAPLASSGIAYIGTIAVDDTATVEQAFIVSGTTASGIYNLPITLRYSLPDGSTRQDNLSLSLVVVAPPRLLIEPPQPLPEMLNAGEPFPLTLTLKNAGTRNINLTEATFTASNGEMIEGSAIVLQTLKTGEETSLTAVVLSQEEGAQTVTVMIHYLDDINQPQTITQTYEAQVMLVEAPIEEPPMETPPPAEPVAPTNWFGRIMLALLGLGS